MTILIADRHAVIREGLRQFLAQEFPQAKIHLSAAPRHTLESLRLGQFDLLLLDLFLPGGDGVGLLRVVRRSYPHLAILVVGTVPEEELGLSILRAGAGGYLQKQTTPKILSKAVRKILSGGKYVSATMAERLALEASRGGRPLHKNLSTRELQVLRLVAGGQCLKEIAGDLSLSVKTVRTYRARLLEKLHLQSDVDLVYYALDHHIVERNTAPSFPLK
jgi:two-component system, NarL family, invasion response regulator UvrY